MCIRSDARRRVLDASQGRPCRRPARRRAGACLFLALWGLCGGPGHCAPPAPVARAGQSVAQLERPQPPPQPRPADEPAPPPRPLAEPVPPFGPGRVRLPRLEGRQGPLGTTPVPTPKVREEYGRFVEEFIDPQATIDLVQGRTRLMVLKVTPTRTQVSDDTIVQSTLLEPRQLTLLGLRVGSTVLNLWFTDPKDNKEKILSYLVRVIPDPEARQRLERAYQALQEEINEAFPDSVVHLFLVGDKLAVSGQAKDVAEATQILRVVRANAPPEETARIPVDSLNLNVTPDPFLPGGLPGLRDFLLAGGPNVINLLRVPGEQQVMLKVTVAEVNRAAARSIGLNFTITNDDGVNVFQNVTGAIASGGPGALFAGFGGQQGIGQTTNNLPVALDNGQISLAINALRTVNYARSLAEPNLVAINGQTASFQAGGQFPVPIVSNNFSNFGGALQGVNFVPFGVLLNFTPYITDKDRIRLAVSAEVSTRDLSTGANISGAGVPGLNTRNFQTTVELREGETLAVAGLIQTNLGADATRVPFLGDLPILNNLTGLTRMQSGEQELVVLVTPELVHPLEPEEVGPLPGSDLYEPGDLEFYVLGRLESYRNYDYRATVRHDIHRMKAYRRCEMLYIYGPHGHTEPPYGP